MSLLFLAVLYSIFASILKVLYWSLIVLDSGECNRNYLKGREDGMVPCSSKHSNCSGAGVPWFHTRYQSASNTASESDGDSAPIYFNKAAILGVLAAWERVSTDDAEGAGGLKADAARLPSLLCLARR